MDHLPSMSLHRLQARLHAGPWAERLPMAASVVLVAVTAWMLAGLAWSVLAPQPPVPEGRSAVSVPAPQVDPQRIVARHLFGRSDAAPAVTAVDAPETRLNLTLRGISASESRRYARALIAGPDGKEQVYAVGGGVPGGASVHEIHADRVLLNRRGTLETLRLPQPRGDTTPARAGPQRVAPVAVDSLREEAGAEQLAEIVRPQAVMVGGQLRGYRVYPGRDRQRFAALGLRAGDLVTAIDGVTLDDPVRSIEAMQALGGSGEVTLTVERGDEVETVTVRAQQ